MLRSFLRATARWAGILPDTAPEPREAAPLFSTDVMPAGQGRARMAALTGQMKGAKVPYAKRKVRAAMDAKDCGGVVTDLWGDDVGASVTDTLLGWFSGQRFIGYAMCSVLAQHWLIDKACTMPARDAVRHGYGVGFKGVKTDEEAALREQVEALDKGYRVKYHLQDFIRKGRMFGIRLALFRVDLGSDEANRRYYENPFNPDAVKPGTYRGIRQIDQYWMAPEMDEAASGDPIKNGFYEPTWWNVSGRRIHYTHFAVYRAAEVPDNLKPYYLFGGISIPQRIMERVYAAERVANEAPLLSLAKRIIVWSTDLENAMTDKEAFSKHLATISRLQNNYGIWAQDTDDTVTAHDTSLADFDAVMMGQYQLTAAIAGVPATKLIETTPKGFNATGEFETRSYHENLESMQENDLSPLLDKHHMMVRLSDLELPEAARITHDWAPVDSPTAKEYAEVNKLNAETDAALVNAGILDPVDGRARLRADPNSNHANIPQELEADPDADPA